MTDRWEVRAVCECGWTATAPFADLFHVHATCCPKCGRDKSELQLKPMRLRSLAVWWNPLTWGSTTDWEAMK